MMKIMIIGAILIIIVGAYAEDELLGYDCSGPGVSTKVISLVDVGECKKPTSAVNKDTEWVQLLQLTSVTKVEVSSCRVFKSTWFYRCGMHSHQMLVGGPFLNEPIDLPRDDCLNMIRWGRWEASHGNVIGNIKINKTLMITLTEDGSLESDGTCSGITIHSHGQTYEKSFSRVTYDIRVTTYFADIDISTNHIFLRDGLVCDHDVGYCFDDLTGLSMWSPYAAPCQNQMPVLLYEGISTIIKEDGNPSLVHIKEGKFMFVSKLNGATTMCARQVMTTDYQKIILLRTDTMNPKLQITKPTTQQINPTLYTNAKLSYLHYSTVNDIEDVYQDVVRQLCQLEQKVLMNLIDLIRLSPQHTKYITGLNSKGTLVHAKGEVAYLTTCPIKKVTLRQESKCYDGLPVTVNNISMFLLPVSRMIVPNVSEIDCTVIAPTLFKVSNHWIAITPSYIRAHEPTILSPRTQIVKNPLTIRGFSEGGIYSSEDIGKFYKSLTHGQTREAVIDTVVTGILTQSPVKYNILSTVNEEGWKLVAKKHINAIWGHFTYFGEIISGFLGVYIVYIIISRIIQLILRTLSLHRLYGCSWKLGAAIWSATTILLTTFVNKKQDQNENLDDMSDHEDHVTLTSPSSNKKDKFSYNLHAVENTRV